MKPDNYDRLINSLRSKAAEIDAIIAYRLEKAHATMAEARYTFNFKN